MFHMYDKKFISVTSHAVDPPSLCHKLSQLLGPPPSSVTYFMDGPIAKSAYTLQEHACESAIKYIRLIYTCIQVII